jgi:hypothetical protein
MVRARDHAAPRSDGASRSFVCSMRLCTQAAGSPSVTVGFFYAIFFTPRRVKAKLPRLWLRLPEVPAA